MRKIIICLASICASYTPFSIALAQTATPTTAITANTSNLEKPIEPIGVPIGTPILIEITDLVSTRTAVRDEMFNIRLAEPIILNNVAVIPAGTLGKGQVVDSGKPKMGGNSAQLVLAVRYLEYEGRQIPIRGLKLDIGSRDHSAASIGLSSVASLAGPAGAFAGLFVTGGHMEVRPGTFGIAKLGVNYIPTTNAISPSTSQNNN